MLIDVILGGLYAVTLAGPGWSGRVEVEGARVEWTPERLTIDTDAARHVYGLSGGLTRHAWRDTARGTDLLSRPRPDFVLDYGGAEISSADGWTVSEPTCERQANGELLLRITLERDGLRAVRAILVYPRLSLLRGWLEVTNTGAAPARLEEPPIVDLPCEAAEPTLLWMSGAENFGDSWKLREEPIGTGRTFDSYDPPAGATGGPGDGVDLRILLGDRQVWPAEGWAHSAHAGDVAAPELSLEVAAGDELRFVLGRHGHMTCDTTAWDPIVAYADGEVHQASAEFGTAQGGGGWRYLYRHDGGREEDMVYDPAPGRYGERWRRRIGVIEPFIAAGEMHPDPEGQAVRAFVAPKAGRVTITAPARNTGNWGPAGPGFRLGSQTYAPWLALRAGGSTAFAGFDCMAHWRAEVGATGVAVRLAGYRKELVPGDTIRTPYSFAGVVGDDLDAMGAELYEWQYAYLWDYTREPWFPAIRMLGYWMKGTTWGSHGWVGGEADMGSAFRKVFRTADFMRQVGGDTYHRDWGWWDRAGDWNGPDFRTTGEYLRQYGMGQLIYAFIYTVDGESSVARAHPDWLANPNTLDQSLPAVVEYEVDLLHAFCERFGPYQWRNDSTPLAPRDGDDTVLLDQQQGFMEVLRRFQDAHPDCAFQGVNGGGMAIGWEYLGLASGFQFTDGQSQMLANYHASYLFPPDKINNMPDIWDPAKYDPATWRGLLCSNFDLTGDTFDPDQIEGIRLICDIYHYLGSQGVVGRWVRIVHPRVEGDDETMFLQRLSWDRRRGVIITKHHLPAGVTVWPKGLVPDLDYEVTFQDSPSRLTRTGAELMESGLSLVHAAPGELIYLNLSDHPGNRWDTKPPRAPRALGGMPARWMGVPGVQLTWDAGDDETWLSGYGIYRDGERLERVDKGTFYFDHSAGADPAARYEVRAIDGSGNESAPAAWSGTGSRRRVTDDADLTYTGEWQREPHGAAHRGTLSNASAAGAAMTFRFTGRAVTLHSRLGAAGGLARIHLDGREAGVVSCYSADEIPGWPIFEHAWDEAGEHELRLEVLGEPGERSNGSVVWIDAVAVE